MHIDAKINKDKWFLVFIQECINCEIYKDTNLSFDF